MGQAAVTIRMDADIKRQFDALCQDFGMSAGNVRLVFQRRKYVAFLAALREDRKNTPKGNGRDPSTTPLCHGWCRCRHQQPCSAAVLYFSAQPDQCYPGAGTGSEAGAFQDGKLCGEPDAAGISEIHPAAKGCTADKIRANNGERYKSCPPLC